MYNIILKAPHYNNASFNLNRAGGHTEIQVADREDKKNKLDIIAL